MTRYKKFLALRKQNPALQSNNIDFFHENLDVKVLAYTRWHEEGSRVVVVANFSDSFLSGYKLPNFPVAGIWNNWTRNYDMEAGESEMRIDLPGYEAQVLVLKS